MKKHLQNNDINELLKQIPKPVLDIDVNDEWHKFGRKVSFGRRAISRTFYYAAAIAAVIAILFAVYVNTPLKSYKAQDQVLKLTLKDNSVVTLNKGSELKIYPFYNLFNRKVSLEGTAFFEVAHNPAKPFIVSTGGFDIEVKGTKFVVFTGSKKVSVIEGVVEVKTGKSSALVTAGQKAEITGKQIRVKNTATVNDLAWKTGTLKFDDLTLEQIAGTLSDLYGVKIIVADDVSDLRVTASFKDQDISSIIKILANTLDLKVSHSNNTYTLYK